MGVDVRGNSAFVNHSDMARHFREKDGLIVGALILLILSISRFMRFFSVNGSGKLRDCDFWGCGHFHAPRGNRKHNGLDFSIDALDAVYAPFPCKVIRHGYPYSDDLSYKLLEIKGVGGYSDYSAKIMYVKDLPNLGDIFKEGQKMCVADDLVRRYDSKMINHVHFELYIKGKLVNPENYFK